MFTVSRARPEPTPDVAPSEEREHLLRILNSAGEAFVSMRADGTVDAWNGAAQQLLGWTPPEILGRDLLTALVPPGRHETYRRGITGLRAAGPAVRPGRPVQIRVLHRDGHELRLEARVGSTAGGEQGYVHAFLRPVTERRETAHASARAEALLRQLAETSEDLITRHAPDGRLIYASPAAVQILGLPPEELAGQNPWDLMHPADLAVFSGADGRLGTVPPPARVTVRLRHRDGHWVWVEAVIGVLRDSHGMIEEVQVRARKVTDPTLDHSASHLDSKLESLGRLSAGLAHEINSPIQFVGDNARFLAAAYQDLIRIVLFYRALLDSPEAIGWDERRARMQVAEEGTEFDYLQEEIPKAVEQTLEGIKRVSTIVRAMKTFSHPGHPEQVPADLNEALEATVTVTRHQVSSVADLKLELGAIPPVRCNIADLNQVFLNLIVNAADAIADTGIPGVIGVSTMLDGDDVVVRISDTGTGIPDDVRLKIFDPFFTTKEVGRGTGQGLPLVRAVVHEGHGGLLTVDTIVGAGTTFTIRLPVDGRSRPTAQ